MPWHHIEMLDVADWWGVEKKEETAPPPPPPPPAAAAGSEDEGIPRTVTKRFFLLPLRLRGFGAAAVYDNNIDHNIQQYTRSTKTTKTIRKRILSRYCL